MFNQKLNCLNDVSIHIQSILICLFRGDKNKQHREKPIWYCLLSFSLPIKYVCLFFLFYNLVHLKYLSRLYYTYIVIVVSTSSFNFCYYILFSTYHSYTYYETKTSSYDKVSVDLYLGRWWYLCLIYWVVETI
jgi:hypothetical protein